MKLLYKFTAVLCLFCMLACLPACDNEINSTETLQPLEPAQADSDAGNWQMIVLSSSDQLELAPPAEVSSEAYQQELAAIKNLQANLSAEQQKAIAYWSAGGVLRWNQILRELVARFNLPPAPRADGTYPAPDAENPFADPNFPFANPPYAARAYSYVSVAQYEAMKTAWHYKYLYNRAAPHVNDPAIRSLMPAGELPAYPSEDAVLSGVSVEMLKLLFPVAVEEITKKAAEQRNAALWSGKAAASDISAGLALGKAVAQQVIARAATDGMKNAVGTPVQWRALETEAEARGEISWVSLESPRRPPMLPLFGQVKAWNMTPEDIVKTRPVPPPSTSSSEMLNEVEEVKWYSENMTRERLAIVHKWADGVGTYTPPGHWNDIASEYISNARFSEVRAARAFALLNMAMHDAAVSCWETKFYYCNPRPSQMNPAIKTGTGVPNFPAFTSGHSNFSGSASRVLSHLFPEHTTYFNEQAYEASMSRLYGAIHYRSDVEKGLIQGNTVGSYTVEYALQDGAE